MTVKIIEGDCLDKTKQYENFFDSIVTDPPYGLKFMGKEWDHGVPGKHYWERFLLSAKPGAHLLAFGGTRTHHRLMVAIEDAGWEIRDCLMWVYGSGFPKSLNVQQAINKAANGHPQGGSDPTGPNHGKFKGGCSEENTSGRGFGAGAGSFMKEFSSGRKDDAGLWSGWGTALKPAWEPIILARKPLEGTVAENVQKWGCGGINIDGCRVALNGDKPRVANIEESHCNVYGWSNGGIHKSGTMPANGRFPANLIHDGSQTVLDIFPQSNGQCGDLKAGVVKKPHNCFGDYGQTTEALKRNDIGSAARFFYCAKASKSERNLGCDNLPLKSAGECTDRQDGTAGLNSPRAGAGRTNGSRNTHPTVKPIALMRYLCRLVTPPNGIILDPFCGSGSTGVAASLEGFNSVLIEIEVGSADIARARNGIKLPRLPLRSDGHGVGGDTAEVVGRV